MALSVVRPARASNRPRARHDVGPRPLTILAMRVKAAPTARPYFLVFRASSAIPPGRTAAAQGTARCRALSRTRSDTGGVKAATTLAVASGVSRHRGYGTSEYADAASP